MGNFFPSKQYTPGQAKEAWEVKLFKDLDKSLTDTIYTIKINTGSRLVQKSVYIQHLISEEKRKRLKHVIPEDDDDSPVSEVPGENEE